MGGRLLVLAAAVSAAVDASTLCVASADIEAAVMADPTPATYNAKGEYFLRGDQTACAIESFRYALQLDEAGWKPRFNLALALLSGRRFSEALPHLEVAAAGQPQSFEVRIALGSVLADMGRPERAAEEFASAVEIDPVSALARVRLARTLMALGRYVAASAQLEQALGIDPASADSMSLLAAARSKNGDLESAVETLSRLVALHPDHFDGHFNLAAAFAQTERFPLASKHYREALRIDPADPAARLAAAKTEVNLRNFRAAVDLIQPRVDAFPESADQSDVHFVRGTAFRGMGRLEEAERELRLAIGADAARSDARLELGELLAPRGAAAEARAHLERARELDPDSEAIRLALISVLRQLGDQDALDAELKSFEARKARMRRAGMARRAVERGSAHLAGGNPASALNEYRQALQYDPGDANAHYGLALALSGLDRQAERIESLRAAVTLDPALAAAHNELGMALAATGRTAEAESAYKAAILASPQYAGAQGNLGVLYLTSGRSEEAERLFRRAIEDGDRTAPMLVNHGMALAALGHLEDARSALLRAKGLSPADAKAIQALALVERLLANRSRSLERVSK